jgi:hypothetical protein
MSPPHSTQTPNDPAGPPSQMSSSRAPGLDRLVPFRPPPGLPHPPTRLPFLYGYPATHNQYQNHAAGIGMNVPLYFPQYPPLGQHGNAGMWGYGPPGPIPDALPHPSSQQPALPVPAPAPPVAVHAEGAGPAGATGQVATIAPPSTPQVRRIYPNRQVRDGGASRSI